MVKSGRRVTMLGLLFGAVGFLDGSPTAAQQTDRERELEQMVRQLIEKVDSLERRVNELEGGPVETKTKYRIDQLEQSVQRIEESTPPSGDSKEWTQLRKWMSDPMTLRSFWKDGLNFESMDGSVKLKTSVRLALGVISAARKSALPELTAGINPFQS